MQCENCSIRLREDTPQRSNLETRHSTELIRVWARVNMTGISLRL